MSIQINYKPQFIFSDSGQNFGFAKDFGFSVKYLTFITFRQANIQKLLTRKHFNKIFRET